MRRGRSDPSERPLSAFKVSPLVVSLSNHSGKEISLRSPFDRLRVSGAMSTEPDAPYALSNLNRESAVFPKTHSLSLSFAGKFCMQKRRAFP